MGYSENKEAQRISLNLRIDPDKHVVLEEMRSTGFGFAKTTRNRSDVYNEAIGFGIQTIMLRKDIGDKEFDQLWKIINNIDVKRLNLDKIEEMLVRE
jgi:translation elongation factor EF-1beta